MLKMGHSRQRNHRARGAFDEDVLHGSRIALKALRDLHHDVVLIQRLIGRRHLALAKGVRERGVDGQRRNPQPASRVAIDHQLLLQTRIQLVGCHILQRRQLLHRGQQLRRPGLQLIQILADQRVLVLRYGATSANVQLLRGLQVRRHALEPRLSSCAGSQ